MSGVPRQLPEGERWDPLRARITDDVANNLPGYSYVPIRYDELADLLALLAETRSERDEAEDGLLIVHDDLAGALAGHGGLREAAVLASAGIAKTEGYARAKKRVARVHRAALAASAPAADPAADGECSTCGGRGEVAATPGMPQDGPMPCPACSGGAS